MFRPRKKMDWILIVFGAIALFVIITVSLILYLLFSRYRGHSVSQNYSNNYSSNYGNDLTPQPTPEELKNNYKKEVEKQISFVESSDLDITSLAKQLENSMLEIRVPEEERENFLSVTLQIVRMQSQGLDVDVISSKNKILELLKSLLIYEKI